MGYRKEDIPGMIAALESAKSRLWDGTEEDVGKGKGRFLCFVLQCDAVAELAQEAIDPHYTFEGWLKASAGISEYKVPDEFIQGLRLRWIDKMIADLKDYAK